VTRRLGASIVVVAMWLAWLTPTQSAMGASACSENPGTDMPVLLVHGFAGDPSIWKDPLKNAITAAGGYVAEPFDYSQTNTRWVDDPTIGEALAIRIRCLADASKASGGPGKVVIVAHSMGGLAAREASREVGDLIALVITIGTPNLGSWLRGNAAGDAVGALGQLLALLCGIEPYEGSCGPLNLIRNAGTPAARAMIPGSPELARLPQFPDSVPVKAIAGDERLTVNLFGTAVALSSPATLLGPDVGLGPDVTLGSPVTGDGVVGVASALDAAQVDSHSLGGSTVDPCEGGILQFASLPCYHSNLPSDPAVVSLIRRTIQAAATTIGPGQPWGEGSFTHPSSLATDADGNVYVVDERGTVEKYSPDGVLVETFGEGITAVTADPEGVIRGFSPGTDPWDDPAKLWTFPPDGSSTYLPVAAGADVLTAESVAVDAEGYWYLAIRGQLGGGSSDSIERLDASGGQPMSASGIGTEVVTGIAAEDIGEGSVIIYVPVPGEVLRFKSDLNNFSLEPIESIPADGAFELPTGVAIAPDSLDPGQLLVSDGNGRVVLLGWDDNLTCAWCEVIGEWGSVEPTSGNEYDDARGYNQPLPHPVAVDPNGNIYLGDYLSNVILKFEQG